MTQTPREQPIAQNESLCVNCGICCDGTLFQHAPLFEEDTPLLENTPDLKFEDESKTKFSLRCPYFRGCCSIYDKRFTVCRNFRCKLLREKLAGNISEEEASAVVIEAKRLVAAIQAEDPGGQDYAGRKRLRNELSARLADALPDERAHIATRLLRLIALDEFLASRFRKRKRSAELPSENSAT